MDSIKQPDLLITAQLWNQMQADVESHTPLEACGLVGGKDGRGSIVIPVCNMLKSPVRYKMDPAEQLQAFLAIEHRGLELLAIYHSHPHGPDHPSLTDIEEAYYPETIYLIWSPEQDGWRCRAFWIRDGAVHPARLLVE